MAVGTGKGHPSRAGRRVGSRAEGCVARDPCRASRTRSAAEGSAVKVGAAGAEAGAAAAADSDASALQCIRFHPRPVTPSTSLPWHFLHSAVVVLTDENSNARLPAFSDC